MAYLTDKEKRLLFSALSREKKVCKQVDKECCREPYEDKLETVVESLERKFYYDRYEKEIRVKAIDEFAERLRDLIAKNVEDAESSNALCCEIYQSEIDEIAEEMRGAG